MKRILALCLSLAMIMSVINISIVAEASEVKTKTSADFILGEGTEYTDQNSSVAFDEIGDSASAVFHIETAGTYSISFYGGGLTEETTQNFGTAVWVDDARVETTVFAMADSWPASRVFKEYKVADVNLAAGNHQIGLENLEGQYKFSEIRLKSTGTTARVESSCLVRYSDWPNAFTTDGNTNTKFVMFRDVNYDVPPVTFQIGVEEDGLYELSWTIRNPISTQTYNHEMSVKATIDGVEYPGLWAGNSELVNTFTRRVLLEGLGLAKGNHTIKLESTDPSFGYYYVLSAGLAKTAELPPIINPEAEDYASQIGDPVKSEGNGGYVITTEKYDELTYAVNASRGGSHDVYMTVAETSYFNVSLDSSISKFLYTYRRAKDESATIGAYRNLKIGSIDLQAGMNLVTLKNMAPGVNTSYNGVVTDDTGTFTFDKLTFELSKPYYSTGEVVETTTTVSAGGVFFDFFVPYGGYYELTANASAGAHSMMVATADSGESANLFVEGGAGAAESSALIKLKYGKNRIKFTCNNSVTLQSIMLDGAEFVGNEIVSQLNSAGTTHKIAEIIKTNGDSEGEPLYGLYKASSLVLSKEPVYAGMLNQNFKDFAGATNALAQLIYNNLKTPDVALKKGGVAIATLQSGDLSVEVDTKFVGSGKVLAALYKDGKLQIAKSGNVGTTKTTLPLGNVTISEGSWELKVFCFTSLDELKPVAIFTNQKTIYVKTNGDDSKDGSSWDNAVRTIERAQLLARELVKTATGDVVVEIGSGVFTIDSTLNFTNADSGKNGKVIYRGAGAGETIISGGTKVTGWTQSDRSNIYVANVPDVEAARTLYINGYPAQRARSKYVYTALEDWEDTTDNRPVMTEVEANYTDKAHRTDGFTVSKQNFPLFDKPEDLELSWRMLWVHDRTPVKNVVDNGDGTLRVEMDQPYWDWATTGLDEYVRVRIEAWGLAANEKDQVAKIPFWIENDLNLLDEPGEFYFDDDTHKVYYYPFAEEKTAIANSTAEAYLGTTEIMMKVQGESKNNKVQNLVFEDLSFRYGAWNEASTTGVRTGQADKLTERAGEGSDLSNGRMLPSQMQFNFANNIEILNCEFSCLGSGAISMVDGVSNARIEGNSFHDISGTGVIVSTWNNGLYLKATSERPNNIEIVNNVFRRTASEFTDKCGVSIYYADDITVKHNYFKDLPYTGVTSSWGWGYHKDAPMQGCSNVDISYNRFEDQTQVTSDGGPIYIMGNMIDSSITNNFIDGSVYSNGGIYLDSGSAYLTVTDNVVMNIPKWLKHNMNGGYHNVAGGNFTNMVGDQESYHPSANVEWSDVTYMTEDISAYPKAVSIRDNSGLTDEYKYLAEGLDLPSWRTDFMRSEPQYWFVGENSWVDMRNWIEYSDDLKVRNDGWDTKGGPRSFRMTSTQHADKIVLGSGWTKYKVYIPQDGDYTFQMNVAAASNTNANGYAPRGVEIYDVQKKSIMGYEWDQDVKIVDINEIDVLVEGEPISYIHTEAKKVHLTAGWHTFKVKGTYFAVVGPFRFDDGVQRTQNDALFDDGYRTH